MHFTIESIEPQPVVGIRMQVTLPEIGDRVGECLGELMPYVGDRMAGAPLSRWHSWEGDRGEMEVAVPVREPLEGEGRIEASVLPGGRAVVTTHVGPYDGLHAAWVELRAWMEEQGLAGRAAAWEQYVSDCDTTPPEQLETRIVWPV